MNKNILILKEKYDKFEEYYSVNMKRNNIDIFSPLKNINAKKITLFRKIHLNRYVSFPFTEIWFDNWKKSTKKYDLVILFEANQHILDYIHKKNKNAKIVVWNWNKVSKVPNNYMNYDYWSFDPGDCKKYGFKYNHQFYLNEIEDVAIKESILRNVFFIGLDKDRLIYIDKIERILNFKNIETNFFIVADKNKKYNKNDKRIIYENWDYLKVLEMERQSYCLLDINKEGQEGITLRTLEALLFKKKLITNNKFIVDYEFYNPNNIFIIGLDDFDKLNKFFNSTYIEIDKNIINKYSYEHWINNFVEYYFI